MIWLLLSYLFTFSGLNCDHSALVADIYHNAPPIIKAALINVGLAPRKDTVTSIIMKQLPSPPLHLPSPLTMPVSNLHKSPSFKHRNRPHPLFSKMPLRSTRGPPQRVQQLPPLSLPQLSTTSFPKRRKHPRTTYNPNFYQNNFAPLSLSPKIKKSLLIQKQPSIENLQINFRNAYCEGAKNWCDMDATYPEADVGKIVKLCETFLEKMYAPIPLIVPSVDIKRKEDNFSSSDLNSRLSGQDYLKSSLCHVERRSFRPSYARDVNGHWQIVLQSSKYPQRISLELCKNEGSKCNKMAECLIDARCVQKYSYQMLVSIDPKKPNTCPSVRLYSFPTACICLTDNKISNL